MEWIENDRRERHFDEYPILSSRRLEDERKGKRRKAMMIKDTRQELPLSLIVADGVSISDASRQGTNF